MLVVSHNARCGNSQVKAVYFYKGNEDKYPNELLGNMPFLALLARAYREYNIATAQQDRPFDMDYISFAVLRFYNEFLEVLGADAIKDMSPRRLKTMLLQFHHTPNDPRVDKG